MTQRWGQHSDNACDAVIRALEALGALQREVLLQRRGNVDLKFVAEIEQLADRWAIRRMEAEGF